MRAALEGVLGPFLMFVKGSMRPAYICMLYGVT